MEKLQNDVSNFLFKFLRSFFQKATRISLLVCHLDRNGNRNGHTNHGVVTAPMRPIISLHQ